MNVKLCAQLSVLAAALILPALSSTLVFAGDQDLKSLPMKQSRTVRYRAVFHVADADPKKWGQALNNAQNVQEALGKENGEIEIVTNGGGIGMLKLDSEVGTRVQEARKAGIKVVACENTMKRLNLGKEDMLPNIGYTPSGVIEVMQKQQEGWSYVRN